MVHNQILLLEDRMAYRKDFWGKTFHIKAFSFFVSFELPVNQCCVKKYKHKVVYHCGVTKTVFSKNKNLLF